MQIAEKTGGSEKPLRAVVYARVSTKGQAEEDAPLAAQVRECEEYIVAQGWELIEVIQDGGISGRTDERPGFQRMIVMAKEKPRPFDVIVAWKANRLSRKLEHRLTYQALLRRRGVKVVLVKEPEFDGALGFLVESVLAVVDEFLTLQIGEDVLRGQKEIARQGFSAGGRPPKGYRSAKKVVGLRKGGEPITRTAWEPDPEWQGQALQAFHLAAQGKSFAEIVRTTGVVSNKSSLSTYLHNRAFIGDRVYNKQRHVDTKAIRVNNPQEEWVIVPDAHQAIVSVELFDKVQEILSQKRHSNFTERTLKSDYLLSGLLWCPKHQCNYVGWSNHDREYYACSLRNKNLIPASECRLLKKDAIEGFILGIVTDQILQPENVRQGLAAIEEESQREKELAKGESSLLQTQIAEVQEQLSRYQGAVAQGVDPGALAEPMNQCYQRLAALKSTLDEQQIKRYAPANVTSQLVTQVIESANHYLDEGRPADIKLLLRELIERIEVDEEEVTLRYTFKNPDAKVARLVAPQSGLPQNRPG
ncbi:MAG: recombinase family protein [Chloroflexi bacterium]|nr:recombinase family protein [Chloroflexota bacterium]